VRGPLRPNDQRNPEGGAICGCLNASGAELYRHDDIRPEFKERRQNPNPDLPIAPVNRTAILPATHVRYGKSRHVDMRKTQIVRHAPLAIRLAFAVEHHFQVAARAERTEKRQPIGRGDIGEQGDSDFHERGREQRRSESWSLGVTQV
jgi:hypothetical protein